MFSWFKKKTNTVEAEPDQSTIVPRIKNPHFLTSLQAMNIPQDQMPVTEPLVGELLITYSFDLPNMFQMVTGADLSRLGIAPDEIRQLAVDNLKRQLPDLGLSDEPPVKQIVTGGNLEACALLATSFWDGVASETEGELVAVAPSRDVLLFCSSQSAEGLETLRGFAKQVLEEESTHGLSDQLMCWRGSKWELYP